MYRRLTLLALLLALPSLANAQTGAAGMGFQRKVPDAGRPPPVLTKPPALLEQVEPTYPKEAELAGLQADVTLVVDIDAAGAVSNALVQSPVGNGFDEAAIEAVKRFRFSPAEFDGVPGPVRIQFVQHFVLQPPAPPDAGPVDLDAGPPTPPDAGPPLVLRGKVLERGSRNVVPGAAVTLESDEPVFADEQGLFELHAWPKGTVRIQVEELNHQPFLTRELLREGEVLEATYFVMPKSVGMFETVVRSEREKKEVSRHTLQREELTKVPGTFGDPLRVIQNLPGVARAPLISGDLVVRGADPGDTKTLVDGLQLPLLFHFLAGPSVLNAEYIDRIDFYPGGFGAEYGRAIGGIVDVASRPPGEDRLRGTASVDLLDADLFLQTPVPGVEGLTVSVAGRRSYYDVFLRPAFAFFSPNGIAVLPYYWDLQGRVDWRIPGSKHRVGLFAMTSYDELQLTTGSSGNDQGFSVNQSTGFWRTQAYWTWRNDRFDHRLQIAGGKDSTVTGTNTLSVDQSANVGSLRERLAFNVFEGLTLRAGLDVLLERQFYAIQLPAQPPVVPTFPGERGEAQGVTGTTRFDRDAGRFDYGAWAEAQLTLPFGMQLFPGVRLDAYRLQGRWRPSADPRFTLRQPFTAFDRKFAVKGSFGGYHQAASSNALDPNGGNPDLPLEAAWQSSLGFEAQLTDEIRLDVTGFVNHRFDLARRSNLVLTAPDGSLYRINQEASGEGLAQGVEVLIKHDLTRHLFGWVAYTLSQSKQRDRTSQDYAFSSTDQRHILTFIAQYRWDSGWQLGGRFRLVSGTPTGAYAGSTYDADTQSYRSITDPAGARNPLFHQLDLRVDKTFPFELWTLGVYLDVQNVLNIQNQEFVIWDYRYQTSQKITGVPILPTLGVSGSF